MERISPKSKPINYFLKPENTSHRQYLALRRFFLDGCSAAEVAQEFGYSISTVYSLTRDFKERLKEDTDPFFISNKPGRKSLDEDEELVALIIALRKKYFSVPEIKSILDAQHITVSERSITTILQKDGFARLPRRDETTKEQLAGQAKDVLVAAKAKPLSLEPEIFSSQSAAVLCFLPVLKQYGLDRVVANSQYPGTSVISKLSAILSFLVLKLSNIRRYGADDIWCMDRGMGLFAGLNVLPKTAWFSSYSSSVTTDMNRAFLQKLYQVWQDKGLLSDTVNLDFTTIPYWGDDTPFENNWSGKRRQALTSMLAVLAQDPESGIICYGDTTIRHDRQDGVVLEFLDFYRSGQTTGTPLRYLAFDSKFTSYENLNKINQANVKFITIRRRGKNIVAGIEQIPDQLWRQVRIPRANGRSRIIKIYQERVRVKGYEGELNQIAITGNGKIKPALIISNEFDLTAEEIVRKYSRRWLIEKEMSEQIEFFHLNRNSSGMVIKVDFDLTMSIFAHNVYRLFALQLPGYSHCSDQTIYEKFIQNAGEISISDDEIVVRLKRKRNLPLLLEQMNDLGAIELSWLGQKMLRFVASTTT